MPKHSWATGDPVEQWVDINFIKKYRVDKIRIKQLFGTDYKQIKDVGVVFHSSNTFVRVC